MKGAFFMSTITQRQVSAQRIKKLVMAAMFSALAFASMFVMRINVMFLTCDVKDTVVTIAGLLFGPLYSLGISFVVAVLEFISIGDTGFWGLLMDFLSTAVFSCTCALIYKYKKNLKGAIVGLCSAALTMTAFMLLFNLFIVPIYTPGYTTAAVAAMVPSLFLPFNLTKGILNAALVLVLYKPVSNAMKAARVLPASNMENRADKNEKSKHIKFSLMVTLSGVLVAALCVLVFFVFLNGDFSLVG